MKVISGLNVCSAGIKKRVNKISALGKVSINSYSKLLIN